MVATVGDPRDTGQTGVYLAAYTPTYVFSITGSGAVTSPDTSTPAVAQKATSSAGVT